MITPAFLVILLIRFIGRRAEHPRVKAAIRAVLLAGAGLLLSASVPLARDAITGPLPFVIVAISFLLIGFTRTDTIWVILGAAVMGLTAFVI
jgi:chromate transporter